jgi:hypothetical protein
MKFNTPCRWVSFSDVVTIPEFESVSQFDLLQPKYDSRVSPYLFKLGIDIGKRVHVQACRHRNLQHNVVLGYRYVGFERTDRDWLKCKHSSIQALIESQTDLSLATDLYMMSAEGLDWETFAKAALAEANQRGYVKVVEMEPEDDYEPTLSLISSLQQIQKSIRGGIAADENMTNPGATA